MSIFCTRHPIITLVIVGMICSTIAGTASIIANAGKQETDKEEKKKVESVEE